MKTKVQLFITDWIIELLYKYLTSYYFFSEIFAFKTLVATLGHFSFGLVFHFNNNISKLYPTNYEKSNYYPISFQCCLYVIEKDHWTRVLNIWDTSRC